VRAYRPDDLDDIITIFVGAVRQVACRDYTPAQIDAWAEVDRDQWRQRRLSRPTWVAVFDCKPVGFADLAPCGHLDMMYVHAAHQRIGVATLLLASVEAAARAQCVEGLSTDASITGRPFFERRGFAVVSSQQVTVRGQSFSNFRMWKVLPPDRAA
jgi:putative acetyltransferase